MGNITMKYWVSAVVLALAPLSSPALAGTWTGGYGGVLAGYTFDGRSYATTVVPFGAIRIVSFANNDFSGGSVGARVGCNIEVGSLVFGPEIAGYYHDAGGSSALPGTGNATGEIVHSAVKSHYGADEALRFGWANRMLMLFGKVGASETNFQHSGFISALDGTPLDLLVTGNKTSLGLLLGGGVEATVTRRVSVSIEYNNVYFGHTLYPFVAELDYRTPGPVLPGTSDTRERLQMVRIGINYRFF